MIPLFEMKRSFVILFSIIIMGCSLPGNVTDNCFAQFTPSSRMKTGFYIGANGGYLYPEYFWMYKDLGFNTNVEWGFLGDWQPWYSWMGSDLRTYGGFFDVLSGKSPAYTFNPSLTVKNFSALPDGYIKSLTGIMTKWYEHTGIPNTAFYRSSKIDKSCFGQRSTYQAEDNAQEIKKRPGYGYVVSETGRDEDDAINNASVRVKHCVPGRDRGSKYIVRNLYENNEQTNVITQRDYGNAYYSDRKRPGDDFRWYVKPRMRIDKDFAANPSNSEKKVVRVEILNYDGNPAVDPVDIKVGDFFDGENSYDGGYVEMYRFDGKYPYKLSVPGRLLATDNIDTSAYYTPVNKSRVDYRIFWYGDVDVRLDYVRLDDEWAHFLFTDPYGKLPVDINKYKFGEKIESEVKALSNLPGFGYFYVDEFYYNNIPCVAEVLRLIKSVNPETGIVVLGPPAVGTAAGIKNELTSEESYDYMEKLGLLTDMLATQTYPIFDFIPIPPNLRKPDANQFPGTVKYTVAPDNDTYNESINRQLLTFRDTYKTIGDKIKNNTSRIFISTVQSHSVETNFIFAECGKIPDYERKREPTNEEISLQAYYAMTYGARQVHYFNMFSSMADKKCGNQTLKYYDWGFTFYDTDRMQRERDTNYYGQKKITFVKSLDENMMKMGMYMYSQNNLVYENTVSVSAGEKYGYITDLKAYHRNSSAPFGYDTEKSLPEAKTYFEIGFFSNPSEPSSKYFLVLNKSCIPETYPGSGDYRKVRIFLNTFDFRESDNWILLNPVTGSKISLSKNDMKAGIILPDEFKPGEAMLYKLYFNR